MVVIDSLGAKGHTFDYEKLFGAKPLTKTDLAHIEAGEDNSIARTMRLFYVVCTRAKHSLAVVAYTMNPDKVKETCLNNEWFTESEISIM